MMAQVSENHPVTSEEMNVFMRHADFVAGCFQEKCEAVLKLTSAADAEDQVQLIKNIVVLESELVNLHCCCYPSVTHVRRSQFASYWESSGRVHRRVCKRAAQFCF